MTSLIAGPVIGSTLYSAGGFMLPFLCVGCVGIILAVCLVYAIPTGEYDKKTDIKDHNTETLSWSNVLRVIKTPHILFNNYSKVIALEYLYLL